MSQFSFKLAQHINDTEELTIWTWVVTAIVITYETKVKSSAESADVTGNADSYLYWCSKLS